MANVKGVSQLAALQMSVSEVPCARAQEKATFQEEWAFPQEGNG